MPSKPPGTPREAPQEQEQSIKARKHQLFEKREANVSAVRPFVAYLGEVPAAPLSGVIKGLLWGLAAVVLLLLIAAIVGGRGPRPAVVGAPPRFAKILTA